MKAVECEGASVEEAVERALLLLGLEADAVRVDVVRDPSANGSAETAIVRVTPKESGDAPQAAPLETPPVEAEKDRDEAMAPQPRTTTKPKKIGSKVETQPSRDDVSRETGPGAHSAGSSQDDEAPLTEEEGERADRAADFLDDLFEALDVDCYVEIAADRVDGKILIDIAGPDTGVVIGRKGAVLDAIEFVVNRAMDNADGGGIRIALDAEGYRERRAEKLRSEARTEAAKVKQTKRAVHLEPMTARERRIVHMALRDDPAVTTRSEGEGPDRHVIIEPVRARARQ